MITEENNSFLYLLLRVELHTLLIGVLPVLALILYKNNKELKRQIAQAEQTNRHITDQNGRESNENKIQLKAESGKIELYLFPHEILYIKAEGNYLEVYFTDTSINTHKHLLRNRLKDILILLPHNFFECHRSYVINIDSVIKAEGNAREMRLFLRGISQTIPVSRSKAKELLLLLEEINPTPAI